MRLWTEPALAENLFCVTIGTELYMMDLCNKGIDGRQE